MNKNILISKEEIVCIRDRFGHRQGNIYNLYFALLSQVQDDGVCCPTMAELKQLTGLDLCTVNRLIHQMRDNGIIDYKRPQHRVNPNRYTFPMRPVRV